MKLAKLAVAASVFVSAALDAPDVRACGGCFVQQSESTQVTGHRMILSVSNLESTLWDQFSYAGNPASFAWVLPTKGVVQIGLSSDALFQLLEDRTRVVVESPQIVCPPPPDCGNVGFGGAAAGGAGGGGGSGVVVMAEEVVGPYETVQLSAQDPAALTTWLTSHGYAIPPDIVPVIALYVNEGFDFLALKLLPGQGVNAMRPVRVTTPGASPVLPLRMVAAGTGAVTPITLWVLGEGRYEPSNFPSFRILESELVWNWDIAGSNYAELRQAAIDASGGFAWIIEAGEPISKWSYEYPLLDAAEWYPETSGYGDEAGAGALEEATADVGALFGAIDPGSLTISRLHGQLSREALGSDLVLGASADQSPVQRDFTCPSSIGTPPPCPQFPPCPGEGASGSGGDAPGGGAGQGGGGSGTVGRGGAGGAWTDLPGGSIWDVIFGGIGADGETSGAGSGGAGAESDGGCASRGPRAGGSMAALGLLVTALVLARLGSARRSDARNSARRRGA